ncbi:hypothetical protein LXL04_006478 [Taraxacum kok-saghyz]
MPKVMAKRKELRHFTESRWWADGAINGESNGEEKLEGEQRYEKNGKDEPACRQAVRVFVRAECARAQRRRRPTELLVDDQRSFSATTFFASPILISSSPPQELTGDEIQAFGSGSRNARETRELMRGLCLWVGARDRRSTPGLKSFDDGFETPATTSCFLAGDARLTSIHLT